MNNRITYIEEKLTTLREDWKVGSPAMKKFIEAGAKLLKEERDRLIKTAEKVVDNQQGLDI